MYVTTASKHIQKQCARFEAACSILYTTAPECGYRNIRTPIGMYQPEVQKRSSATVPEHNQTLLAKENRVPETVPP